MKLANVFETIRKYPAEFVAAGKGTEFEERIEQLIKSEGYTKRVDHPEQWREIKKAILLKERAEPIANIYGHKQEFMVTPNGKQNYPDFLIFEDDYLFCLETKFNKGKTGKPVWNSGLPRPNGIYLLGSFPRRDVTFFLGMDVVTVQQARNLHDFFDKGLKEYQRKRNAWEGKKQKYGFGVYIRKAFDQTKKNNPEAVLDFYENLDRLDLEENVLKLLKSQ